MIVQVIFPGELDQNKCNNDESPGYLIRGTNDITIYTAKCPAGDTKQDQRHRYHQYGGRQPVSGVKPVITQGGGIEWRRIVKIADDSVHGGRRGYPGGMVYQPP